MHLRSVSLRGFKSFPDRTRLEFGPGVSVIVGPNGSGKSNVTDAVLWAMGEQSPLTVRGGSMQDVIFGGGRGRQAATAAEVELVLDNGDGTLDLPFGEISIVRRLDRAGEGTYELNGARCRLGDVIELLSDTGLGKEMHSVVSQGRVEQVITSKPRDRRLLIEEAAGLGKHRRRRRRAQLKLERTQDNLDRALDVEREARSRLRPLKRQAEAAELHERLERQSLEARWELARDSVRRARSELTAAEAAAVAARGARGEAEVALRAVAARRDEAETALAGRAERRDELARRLYAARAAGERIEMRLEGARTIRRNVTERAERARAEEEQLAAEAAADHDDPAALDRVAGLESEREALQRDAGEERAREVAELSELHAAAAAEEERLASVLAERRAAVQAAEASCEAARAGRRAAERAADAARREAAQVGAELAAVNQFLRSHAGAVGDGRTLADELDVRAGCELAVAAALAGALSAAITDHRDAAGALLDRAGRDGGAALVTGGADRGKPPDHSPVAGAVPLREVVSGSAAALTAAAPLLRDAWLVDDLTAVPADFSGLAVTPSGRVWSGARRELRQVPAGGEDRVLAERNRRAELIARTEEAVGAERTAQAAVAEAGGEATTADGARDEADRAFRAAQRARDLAAEEVRRAAAAVARRRDARAEGPLAERRARVEAALAGERRVREHAEAARAARRARGELLHARIRAHEALMEPASALAEAMADAAAAIAVRVEALTAEADADRAAGESVAAELRACAQEEATLQNRLRDRAEAVTQAEVAAQRTRDRAAESAGELTEVAGRLELPAEPAAEVLEPAQREALAARVARLARRREQLGPVNPLAQDEYTEAVAHVEELETRREDLEAALRELQGLIRDTDRQIRESFEETFAAAAGHFERIAAQLFPNGRGALRLVREDSGPRPVLGGADPAQTPEAPGDAPADEAAEAERPEDQLGVEIEITPAGKATKRLSLLSGGEKSLTALAFLFSVFLARPCPFYVLDEVEAALDDLNITRFLELVRAHADRAQFIVVTHQKRTMEAADSLYGVSMGDDGVSKVVSRRLPREVPGTAAA